MMAPAIASKSVKNTILTIGIVSVHVKLLSAARDETSGFHQVHEHEDGSIVQTNLQNFCSGCTSVVPFEKLSKGLEVTDGKFVVVTKAELNAIKPQAAADIVLEKFIYVSEINPVFFNKSFYLVPNTDKKTGSPSAEIAYEALFQSLKNTGKAAIGTMETRGKEHNVVIRVSDNGLMMHSIFNTSDIRTLAEYNRVRKVEANPMHVKMMTDLIETVTVPFDPQNVTTASSETLNDLIENKRLEFMANSASSATKTPTGGSTAPVVDALMASLRASLNNKKAAAVKA